MTGGHAREDPRVARSRGRIVTAARDEFASHGYLDTSVDEIALAAGVTKRTIYNLYPDKEALFRAAVDASIAIAEAFVAELVTAASTLSDPAADLPRLARRLATDILSGPVVSLRLLVAHEAGRFPDLAAGYRTRAPQAVLSALATSLQRLAVRGLLVIDDPGLAAEHFAFLAIGAELDRRMLGAPPSSAVRIGRAAQAGAQAFLRAYRP